MGRGKELSDFQRGTVVGCHLSKKSIRETSAMLKLPRSTVSAVILKWKREGVTTALPRCGRPHKLKEEDRQVLERVALQTGLSSTKALTAEFQLASGTSVSIRTVQRELREMGFRGRVSSYGNCRDLAAPMEDVLQLQEKEDEKVTAPCQQDANIDVSCLDLRVGRVISALQLPDSDGLYMQLVDVGEPSPRTVVSEQAKEVPEDQMQNRLVILLCNQKAALTRGVANQAVLLCACSSHKVEILEPPSGAMPGDRVTFTDFTGEPDDELNPKQNVWEQILPDLRTDARCIATYKGVPFQVEGKGLCKAQTLSDSEIK
ncbi:aminoacyl tRNA synthase complex-interacting multifunctional protein 1-like [Gouania willdenowi]|uniref:Aminoacyl tRNA synthase complex-interacting multifunctional protein 1-like n=1 Tax=Gouania willdenowi TaxID=441366 RepID=A0A8C5E8R1_GOUWI|nr:aminoacyl tRNA synthase complex-interacting multifunctional protein 1-like [Gouania willdenowi]